MFVDSHECAIRVLLVSSRVERIDDVDVTVMDLMFDIREFPSGVLADWVFDVLLNALACACPL